MNPNIENLMILLEELKKKDLSTDDLIFEVEQSIASWKPYHHLDPDVRNACSVKELAAEDIMEVLLNNAIKNPSYLVENLEKVFSKRSLAFMMYRAIMQAIEQK